jgi:thiol:disulfide interchange protein DsbD
MERLNDSTVRLYFDVKASSGIRIYRLPEGQDVLYSEIDFDSTSVGYVKGKPTSVSQPLRERDAALGEMTAFHQDSVRWQQDIRLGSSDIVVLKGELRYMYKRGDEFLNGSETFRFEIAPIPGAGDASPVGGRSLWWIFIAAFGGGLLALLTPCVYSMIPVTVSFFTKRSMNRAQGIRNAMYYAASIIIIFTLLGFLITLVFGPAALNNLATNWIANLVFFALFLIFGISFLGAFEINLPSSWMNRSDSRAGTTSFVGIFFMALTLVLVSFSCTGPIIGNLLVLAAKGSYLGPLVGML